MRKGFEDQDFDSSLSHAAIKTNLKRFVRIPQSRHTNRSHESPLGQTDSGTISFIVSGGHLRFKELEPDSLASVQTQKHPKESQFDRETLMSVLRAGRVKHLVVQISSRFGYLLIYWKSPGLSCKRKHISAWERTLNQHRSALHRSILSCLTQLLSLFLSPSYPPTSAALFASTVIPPGDSNRII